MKLLGMLMALALTFALAGFAQAAPKADKAARKAKALAGQVVSVDGTKLTIKTRDQDKNVKEVVVTTDASTKVTVDGKDGKLSDISAGMRVKVSPAEGLATSIEATAAKPRGNKKNQ